MNWHYFSFTKKNWNISLWLFIFLIVVSFGYYATATEEGSGSNFFEDTDQDGLSNEEEKSFDTDPENPDTDADGYSDGVEIESGYNPLLAAPGDRVVPEDALSPTTSSSSPESNVTIQTSNALAEIVQDVTSSADTTDGVKMEDIDTAIADALDTANKEIVFPEIKLDDIKVKKVSKKLKGEKKEEQIRKDVIEYLTYVSYVIISNSPIAMQRTDEFEEVAEKISNDSLASLMSGNLSYLDTLEEQGEKFLEQMKDVEVPEQMLDIHVRALQLGLYASELKKGINNTQTDPLGQVAAYGSIQAFLLETQSFAMDVQTKISEYGIQGIPIDL